MSVKVSAGLGLTGMAMAMIAALLLGVGIIFALGLLIWLSPMTAAVLIIIIFLVLNMFMRNPQKGAITAILLFLIVAILFGKEIQSLFEAIPVFGIIFKLTGGIL